jgi:hypothetical protein
MKKRATILGPRRSRLADLRSLPKTSIRPKILGSWQAIPGKFAVASWFFKGLAHVRMVVSSGEKGTHAGTFEYIDLTGRVVFRHKS